MTIFTTIKEAMSFVNKAEKELIIRKVNEVDKKNKKKTISKTYIFDMDNNKIACIDLKMKV